MIVAAIVIAFVIIVVILAVILYAVPQVVGSDATLNINVHSTHLLFSVDFNLYIDGSLAHSGTIDAGYYAQGTYTYHWSSRDSTVVHVSATSTGGGFGSQSDYADVVVSNGGAYVIDLHV